MEMMMMVMMTMSCHDTFFNIFVDTNDVDQVIAAEGENSAAQALRNASEVNFSFNEQLLHWVKILKRRQSSENLHVSIQYPVKHQSCSFLNFLSTGDLGQFCGNAAPLSPGKIQVRENSKPIILSG